MQVRLEKFLEVLRIELEDLERDIASLVDLYKSRKDSREITNYVYLENKGLLVNQLHCIASLLDALANVDTTRYASLETMIDALEEMITEKAQSCASPQVVATLVRRKIAKVQSFISSAE